MWLVWVCVLWELLTSMHDGFLLINMCCYVFIFYMTLSFGYVSDLL
jgi:hypothetical protein